MKKKEFFNFFQKYNAALIKKFTHHGSEKRFSKIRFHSFLSQLRLIFIKEGTLLKGKRLTQKCEVDRFVKLIVRSGAGKGVIGFFSFFLSTKFT